jgi:hypothetical protein
MKKTWKITVFTLLIALLISSVIPAYAEEIPRESLPRNTPPGSIPVAERLISGILDEVAAGMGYSDAKIKAHNTILDAVLANETDGYGFAILKAIANNAIFEYRDMYLRPEYYKQAEEQVRVLISDLIEQVKNGGNYEEARKAAYTRIYQTADPSYNPDEYYLMDFCYWDVPAVDSALFNRARKLLLDAQEYYEANH